MRRDDLYYVKQQDFDARFVDIVSGGGALPSSPVGTTGVPHLAAAPRTPYRFVCDLCGFSKEVYDAPDAVLWCSHRGRADGNKPCLMKRVERGGVA